MCGPCGGGGGGGGLTSTTCAGTPEQARGRALVRLLTLRPTAAVVVVAATTAVVVVTATAAVVVVAATTGTTAVVVVAATTAVIIVTATTAVVVVTATATVVVVAVTTAVAVNATRGSDNRSGPTMTRTHMEPGTHGAPNHVLVIATAWVRKASKRLLVAGALKVGLSGRRSRHTRESVVGRVHGAHTAAADVVVAVAVL